MMKLLFEFLAKQLVEKQDAVVVDEKVDGFKTKLIIKVEPSDLGKVIGKEGKTIKSLRALAASLSTKENTIVIDLHK